MIKDSSVCKLFCQVWFNMWMINCLKPALRPSDETTERPWSVSAVLQRCVSATWRALTQCSLVNTRSLHLHSIRQGSITAQWGYDDRTESICMCVLGCSCVLKYQVCYQCSQVIDWSSVSRRCHWFFCQVTLETLSSAGALRLPLYTPLHTHAQVRTHTQVRSHVQAKFNIYAWYMMKRKNDSMLTT